MNLIKQYVSKKEFITALASGALLLILGWVLEQYTPIKIATWIISIIVTVIKSVFDLLNILFPLWVSVLAFLAFLVIRYVYLLTRGNQVKQNQYLKYRDDIFNDVKYKWGYKRTKKQYEIVNIKAYCVECGCRLSSNECPQCKKAYLNIVIGNDVENSIKALICHKLEYTFRVDEYEKIK